MWRTASGILSGVSFHGYRLTCAFGARCTVSIATAYGCPGTSSGRTRIGVGPAGAQLRAPALHVILVGEVGHLWAEPAGLRRHGGDNAVTGPLQQIPDERAADAEAEHHEVPDAEMIHQAEMIVGIGVPWPVHCKRPRGLAALGVAQIGRDHAALALELVERVERVGREARHRGVQPATGDDQQREAGTDLLIVDADVALLIQWHGRLSLHSVVFRGRSPIAQPREPLECSERHGCAAPLLCGYSCTRSGAAGQDWRQPGEDRTSTSSTSLKRRRV